MMQNGCRILGILEAKWSREKKVEYKYHDSKSGKFSVQNLDESGPLLEIMLPSSFWIYSAPPQKHELPSPPPFFLPLSFL